MKDKAIDTGISFAGVTLIAGVVVGIVEAWVRMGLCRLGSFDVTKVMFE